MLSFSVLASGSSGNAIFVATESTRILLDAGISAKQLALRLKQTANLGFSDLSAVLVTHEHVDHVRGLRQVLKQSRAPLHLTEGSWSALASTLEEYPPERLVHSDASYDIGDIRVTPFTVSHDAEEPVAYRFDADGMRLAVVTDLGYVSDHIKSLLEGCDAYVFESNHDVDMLRAGRYPWSVKRRILGDKGHLSNTDAAVALLDVLGDKAVDVYLAHLSEENNQPDLADLTVSSILTEAKAIYGEQVTLHRTSRYEPTPLATCLPHASKRRDSAI